MARIENDTKIRGQCHLLLVGEPGSNILIITYFNEKIISLMNEGTGKS